MNHIQAICAPHVNLKRLPFPLYKGRWQIECLFAETKTRSFNIEDTRLTIPGRLSLLLALVAIAMAWSLACACALIGRNDIPRASHGFRRKSCFRAGFDALRQWIVHNPEIAGRTWHRIWRRRTNPDNKSIRVVWCEDAGATYRKPPRGL